MSKGHPISRRAFLSGCAITAATAWICDSQDFSARLIRGAAGDFSRELSDPEKPTPSLWNPNGISAAWIGHATVLINFYGTTILTDPVMFDRVGADLGFMVVGRKRLVEPALKIKDLPKVDLVLLSHAHMDHLDVKSLNALPKGSTLITAAGTLDLVDDFGFKKASELKWGASTRVHTHNGALEVAAFEVKHWGARWKSDIHRGYNGYVLRKDGREIVFGGDTAYCDSFRRLSVQPDLAIMPIGSYGSKSGNHCTPEEAIQMANECNAKFILPVHHNTFPIGKEPLEEPIQRFQAALEPARVALTNVGQTWFSAA